MEQNNLNQDGFVTEQKSSVHQVTLLSKYLAFTLFIILPFLGGYIGYTFAPEKEVEVKTVLQPVTAQDNIMKSEFNSVVSEIVGGIRDIDKYWDDNETEIELMNQIKNERYSGTLDDNTLKNFVLALHGIVKDENFEKVASYIPKQGFFYTIASGPEPVTGRSRIAGSQVYSQAQVARLLPSDRLRNLTNIVTKEFQTSIKTNPARLFGIYYDSYTYVDGSPTDVEPTVDNFQCELVTNPVEIEDILMMGIENPSYGGSPEKHEVSFADHFYNCSSGWGGAGISIYVQPSQNDGTPEVIGAISSFWE